MKTPKEENSQITEALRVAIWNELRQEKTDQPVKDIYPDGMHSIIAGHLSEQGFSVRTTTLDEPEHGLTEVVLAEKGVLTWCGHEIHNEVSDEIVVRIHERVLEGGMGLIVLHSGH